MPPKLERVETDLHTITDGFVVKRANNGGWLVMDIPEYAGFQPRHIGAFTNDDDLIDFIIAELKPDLRRPEERAGTEFTIDDDLAKRIADLSDKIPHSVAPEEAE